VSENKILERRLKFDDDNDFMGSMAKENPNKDEYMRRKEMLTDKNDDTDDEKKE